MQSSLSISIVITILCCLFSTSSPASVEAEKKILIVGDSLSAAYNIPVEQSWPVLFEQKLQQNGHRYSVINASISGETTTGGNARLPALLEKHRPQHVIIELGGNDGLRGFPFSRSQQNLQQMIETARQLDIEVMLIGVRLPPNLGPVYNQRFQRIYQQLADQFQVNYLPRFLQGVAGSKAEYMQDDGIHPTALAQPTLAKRVFQKFINP